MSLGLYRNSPYGDPCTTFAGAASAISDHPGDAPPPLRIRYQTVEFGSLDIHLCTLRDTQEFRDDDGEAESMGVPEAHWALFGVLWASSRVLANFMLKFDVAGRRVLELGCGTALTSLLLNKQRQDITATDFHPDVEAMLQRNVALNGDETIPFERTGWKDGDSTLGLFDLIIGSDVLYEQENVHPLAQFIEEHAMPTCEVVIVDPGRGQVGRFSREMADYGYDCEQQQVAGDPQASDTYSGRILQYQRA
ncbi:MAG: methyltransferase domain-containing protein [Halioglobus sp.]